MSDKHTTLRSRTTQRSSAQSDLSSAASQPSAPRSPAKSSSSGVTRNFETVTAPAPSSATPTSRPASSARHHEGPSQDTSTPPVLPPRSSSSSTATPQSRPRPTTTATTPMPTSQSSPNASGGVRSALKVYMANQLELSESEMQYYEEAVNELAEQVDQLREENATVQQQKNDLEAELVKFKSSHSSLQDDFNALTRELEHEKDQSRCKLLELNQLSQSLERELQTSRQLNENVDALAQELSNATRQHNADKESYENLVNQLRLRLREEVGALSSQLKDQADKVISWQSRCEEEARRADSADKIVRDLRAELLVLKEESEVAASRPSATDATNEALAAALAEQDRLDGIILDLTNQLDTARGIIEQKNEQIEKLETDNVDVVASNDELQQQLTALRGDVEYLQRDHEEATNLVARYAAELEAKDQELRFSEDSLAQIQSQFEAKKISISSHRSRNRSTNSSITQSFLVGHGGHDESSVIATNTTQLLADIQEDSVVNSRGLNVAFAAALTGSSSPAGAGAAAGAADGVQGTIDEAVASVRKELQEKFDSRESEYQQEIAQLRSSLSTCAQTLSLVQAERDNIEILLVKMESRVNAVSEGEASSAETVRNLQTEIRLNEQKVSEATAKIASLQQSLQQKENEFHDLHRRLETEQSTVTSLQRDLAESQRELRLSQSVASDLVAQTAKERARIDELTLQITSFQSSPSPGPDLEKEVEALEKEKAELVAEIESLKRTVETRDRCVSDLHSQAESLDAVVSSRTKELSALRASAAQASSISQITIEQQRQEIELLNSQREEAELRVNEMEVELRDVFQELADERDVTSDLRTMLSRMKEMAATNDEMEQELKNSRDVAAANEIKFLATIDQQKAQLDFLNAQLLQFEAIKSDRESLLKELAEEREVMSGVKHLLAQLKEAEKINEDTVDEFKNNCEFLTSEVARLKSELETRDESIRLAGLDSHHSLVQTKISMQSAIDAAKQEAQDVQEQFSSLQADMQAATAALTIRIDAVASEKHALEDLLRSQRTTQAVLEAKLREKSDEVTTLNRVLIQISETVQYFQKKIGLQEAALQEHVRVWFDSFNDRIDRMRVNVEEHALPQQIEAQVSMLELEKKLQETELYLQTTMMENKLIVEEKEDLLIQLEDSRLDAAEWERSVLEMKQHEQAGLVEADESVAAQAAELSRLKEQLEIAERMAKETSAKAATDFANFTHQIAMLEAELAKQDKTCAHLRDVNSRLTEDQKALQERALRVDNLEHRLLLSLQQGVDLTDRVNSLSEKVRSKEGELLLAIQQHQNDDARRAEEADARIKELNEKIRSTTEQIHALSRELTSSREASAASIDELQRDNTRLESDVKEKDSEISALSVSLSEQQDIVSDLRNSLQHVDSRVVDLEGELEALRQTKSVQEEAWERARKDFEASIADKNRRLRDLDAQMSAVKARLNEAESTLQMKDEMVVTHLSKISSLTDENRLFRSRLDALQLDYSSLSNSKDELQDLLDDAQEELKAVKAQLSGLQEGSHRAALAKLNETEENLRRVSDDLDKTETELKTRTADLEESQGKLVQIEIKVQQLQAALAQAQGQVEALELTSNNLNQHNQYLQSQLDEATLKTSSQARDMSSLRSQLADYENELALKVNEVEELTESLAQSEGRFERFELSEASLVSEMRSFAEAMMTAPSMSSYMAVLDDSQGSFSLSAKTVGGSSTATDLFASPLPSGSRVVGMSTTSKPGDRDGHPLHSIKLQFDELKLRSETVSKLLIKAQDASTEYKREVAEHKKKLELQEQKLLLTDLAKEKAETSLRAAEEEMSALRASNSSLNGEKEELLRSVDELSLRIRNLLRELNSVMSDGLSKANVLVAGKVSMINDFPLSPSPSKLSLIGSSSPSSASNVDFGTVNLLQTAVKELERGMIIMNNAIELALLDSTEKKAALDKVESHLSDRERMWAKERIQLNESLAIQEASVLAERSNLDALDKHVQQVLIDNQRLSSQLSDKELRVEELEADAQKIGEENHLLLQENKGMQSVVDDLQAKIRLLELDLVQSKKDVAEAQEQERSSKQRVNDLSFELEKANTSFSVVQAEKDAIDSVRKSIEVELDRLRDELVLVRSQNRSVELESRHSQDVEILLQAVTVTLDNLASSGCGEFPVERGSSAVEGQATTPNPIQVCVRRLGDLRLWAREECKLRRSLEDKQQSLELDMVQLRSSLEESQQQVKRASQSTAEKCDELRDKTKELSLLQHSLQRKSEDVDRAKREAAKLSLDCEEERKHRQRLAMEVQQKDTEIFKLKIEVESLNTMSARVSEQLETVRSQLEEVKGDRDNYLQQLEGFKANNQRLSASLKILEKGMAKDKSVQGSLQQKLEEAESSANECIKLRSQVADLTSNLVNLREASQATATRAEELEHQLDSARKELDQTRHRLVKLESRSEQAQREKLSIMEEVSSLRHNLTQVQQFAEAEQTQRIRAEAALDVMKRSEGSHRQPAENYSMLMGAVEDKVLVDEAAKAALRDQAHSLRIMLEEKESQRVAEANRAVQAEREVASLRSRLTKLKQEVTASNERGSALRKEGRHARAQVMEAVNKMYAIADIVKKDARAAGLNFSTPQKAERPAPAPASSSDAIPPESSDVMGLEEALGVPELLSTLDTLRQIVDLVRESPRHRLELQATVQRLEQEKGRLQRDLSNSEAVHEERVKKLREELQHLQVTMAELKRSEGASGHIGKQIAAMDLVLKQERDEKERALAKLARLREENDRTSRELAAAIKEAAALRPTPQHASLVAELETTKADVDVLRRELNAVRQELSAANHHRNVLRETLDQLDKMIRAKSEALAEAQHGDRSQSHNHQPDSRAVKLSSEEADSFRRQIARYKARLVGVEGLSAVYRCGVLALYADGSTYGAAQHAAWSTADSAAPHWIEKEVHVIKASFEEEIHLLDSEVIELRGKLEQSTTYVTELRHRFEDNVKTLYGASKDPSSESLAMQYNYVTAALDKAEAEVQSLQRSLAEERVHAKRRHVSLVEDLVKALLARDQALRSSAVTHVTHTSRLEHSLDSFSAVDDSFVHLPRTRLDESVSTPLPPPPPRLSKTTQALLKNYDGAISSADSLVPRAPVRSSSSGAAIQRQREQQERERERELLKEKMIEERKALQQQSKLTFTNSSAISSARSSPPRRSHPSSPDAPLSTTTTGNTTARHTLSHSQYQLPAASTAGAPPSVGQGSLRVMRTQQTTGLTLRSSPSQPRSKTADPA